jgi:hypothetical protein
MATKKDLVITKGKTFSQVIRWEEQPFVYKAITAITQAAPVRITSATHGVPDGWRIMIESVKGMTQINSTTEWRKATVIDPNTIEINDINSLDFKAYASGGVVKYYTPVSMAGFTGRMTIKDKVGGTAIASSVGVSPTLTVTVDDNAKTIQITMTATNAAALTAKKGVYDLEMVSGTGVVTGILYGSVTIDSEVTT